MTVQDHAGYALVTGASEGIGALYAERLAARGHDLVLVARNRDKLEALATSIREATGRQVEVLPADLSTRAGQAAVAERLKAEPAIEMLVNNAGISLSTGLVDADPARLSDMLAINVGALTLLSNAAATGMVARGHGTIINISSAMAVLHNPTSAAYSGTKAFVLTFTQALDLELRPHGVRVQAVLPGATRTAIWEKAGVDMEKMPASILMDAAELVDAALVGLDQGELVTIPSLPDPEEWARFDAARQSLSRFVSRDSAAPRYSQG